MNTAFVFAPLSSLLRPEDRSRYRHLEEVQARFTKVEAMLRQRRGLRVCFNDLLDRSTGDLCDRSHLNLTAALIITIQLGVVDRLGKVLPKPAWVAGCSLGDVARTVTAGACAFEDALYAVTQSLHEVEEADRVGSNVVVKTARRNPFTAADLAWFASVDLAASQLSDRIANVSGLFAALDLLEDRARQRHWRIFPLLDFPLHSRHAAGSMETAQEVLRRFPFTAPESGIRVYSSVLQQEVAQPEEFREEFIRSLVVPLNWRETVHELAANHAVTTFVNIGPCRTLSKLLQEMGRDVLEADDLIEANGLPV